MTARTGQLRQDSREKKKGTSVAGQDSRGRVVGTGWLGQVILDRSYMTDKEDRMIMK
jgi:hypothetical protein